MKQPTPQELALLKLSEHDLISDADLGRKLGTTRQNAVGRMWRIHKWRIAQRRMKGMKR